MNGKHEPKRIYDTFETREDAEHSKEDAEHIVYMEQDMYLRPIPESTQEQAHD